MGFSGHTYTKGLSSIRRKQVPGFLTAPMWRSARPSRKVREGVNLTINVDSITLRSPHQMVLDEARSSKVGAHIVRVLSHSPPITAFSCPPRVSTMTDNSQRPKGRGKVLPALNMAIDGLSIAKEATSATPVNPVFGSVAVLLTTIRVNSPPLRVEMPRAHT